jgi:hypothetical protein
MEEENDKGMIFDSDGGSFSYNKINDISRKGIIKMILLKIGILSTKEFTEGYVEKKPVNIGGSIVITEVRHPDTRLGYINAVKYLSDITRPEWTSHMEELEKDINDEIENQRAKCLGEDNKYTEFVDFEIIFYRKLFQMINHWIKESKFLDDDAPNPDKREK